MSGRKLLERLTACGVTESSAVDNCMRYAAAEDWEALEEYVRHREELYEEYRQEPSER